VTLLVAVLAVAAVAAGVAVTLRGGGSSERRAHAAPKAATDKGSHLAVLTADRRLAIVPIDAGGRAGTPRFVAPRETSPPGRVTHVGFLKTSADGRLLAWAENSGPAGTGRPYAGDFGFPDVMTTGATSYVMDVVTGTTTRWPGLGVPYGFVHDDLVLRGSEAGPISVIHDGRLASSIELPDTSPLLLTASTGGVLGYRAGTSGDADTVAPWLDLVGYDGTVRPLMPLPAVKGFQSSYEQAWTSRDQTRALLEKGDHTDYCGVGPSSTLTTVDLPHRTIVRTIQSPGPAARQWRLLSYAYVTDDTGYGLWVTCQTGISHRPSAAVYHLADGRWNRVVSGALAMAARDDQTVAVQQGKIIPLPDGVTAPAPSGTAFVLVHGVRSPLALGAVDFGWTV
jgi:hypothetical protein